MKRIIGLLLKWVPRHVLHKWVHWSILRIAFIWKGNQFEDPITGIAYRKMLPYGRRSSRVNALAPHTLSLERHRLLWLFLKNETDFFNKPLRVLHLAPEYCFLKPFETAPNLSLVKADLNSPWADLHFDVHDIPFQSDSFDVILANHLLEHVDDDAKVLAEFHRVLKPGGWGIFQVPMDMKNPNTLEDPSIVTPEDRERHYWQADHVRLYGYEDYVNRLSKAGFQVDTINYAEQLGEQLTTRYCLGGERLVHLAMKPVESTGDM